MNAVSFLDFNDAAPQVDGAAGQFGSRGNPEPGQDAKLEPLLQMLFPHGKRRGREFVVGNLQGEPGDSLCVALDGPRAGMWIDHATGESWRSFCAVGSGQGLCAAGRLCRAAGRHGRLAGDATRTASADGGISIPACPRCAGAAYRQVGLPRCPGRLVACAYRYDTPVGKQYRPWDALRRKMSAPETRPPSG